MGEDGLGEVDAQSTKEEEARSWGVVDVRREKTKLWAGDAQEGNPFQVLGQ